MTFSEICHTLTVMLHKHQLTIVRSCYKFYLNLHFTTLDFQPSPKIQIEPRWSRRTSWFSWFCLIVNVRIKWQENWLPALNRRLDWVRGGDWDKYRFYWHLWKEMISSFSPNWKLLLVERQGVTTLILADLDCLQAHFLSLERLSLLTRAVIRNGAVAFKIVSC